LKLSVSAYLELWEKDPEAPAALFADAQEGEGRFFGHPALFRVAAELALERAALSSERSLRVSILGGGAGFEAASLVMEFALQGILRKGWFIAVKALDFSPKALQKGKSRLYTASETEGLDSSCRRRFFKPSGENFRLKDIAADPISFDRWDPFIPRDRGAPANPPEPADMLFAGGFMSDLPDGSLELFRERIAPLLSPGGLLFLNPGEIHAPGPGLALEERRGVFYFRKDGGRVRANSFFAPKKMKKSPSPAGAPVPAESLELRALRRKARELLGSDPLQALSLALRCVSSAQEETGSFLAADYRSLGEAWGILGRPLMAREILEAADLMEAGGEAP
jgi:chemotaxis protein methyltransferase CheR